MEEAFNASSLHSTDSVRRETVLRQWFVEGLPQQYKRVFDSVMSASICQAVQLAVRQRSASYLGQRHDNVAKSQTRVEDDSLQ